jgi:hypothetical protein
MPLPTILFGVVLSTFYGALFHFLRGGSQRKLLIDLALAWAGFWLGDSLGWYMGWTFASVGVLNAGMGTVLSAIFLLAGDLISSLRAAVHDEK